MANKLSLEESSFETVRSQVNNQLGTLFKYEDNGSLVEDVNTDFQALNSRVHDVFAKTDTQTEYDVL